VHRSCAGIDSGKRSLTVCVIRTDPPGEPVKEIQTFRTLTRDLLTLADWGDERGVTAVAREATGSYWKPIWNLLEDRFELLSANAAHLKAVPGRKTDVPDTEWIAELFRHGLLRASFIPPRPERELRELVRYRTSLIRERASEINRLAKVLEGANIKLGSVSTNLSGVSGRAILAALIEGTDDPEARSPCLAGAACATRTNSSSRRSRDRSGHTSGSCWRRNCATSPTSTRSSPGSLPRSRSVFNPQRS
jgi:transposase